MYTSSYIAMWFCWICIAIRLMVWLMAWGHKETTHYSSQFSVRSLSDKFPIKSHHVSTLWPGDVIWRPESLQLRLIERDGVSNHVRLDRLLNHRSKYKPTLRATGLCEGNPPVTGRFPSQRASNSENVSIWSRHRVFVNIVSGNGFLFLQQNPL